MGVGGHGGIIGRCKVVRMPGLYLDPPMPCALLCQQNLVLLSVLKLQNPRFTKKHHGGSSMTLKEVCYTKEVSRHQLTFLTRSEVRASQDRQLLTL